MRKAGLHGADMPDCAPHRPLADIVIAPPRHPKQSIQKYAASLGIKRRKTNKRRSLLTLNTLWEIREASRIARITLAEAMGYHHVILGRWERGKSMPSLQRLSDWCNTL